MKVMTVLGARPQFVKAAAVSRALARTSGVEEILVHTGQHYDSNMSRVFFDELQIPAPTLRLGVGSGTHGAQTGQMMGLLDEAMLAMRPDWVLVYGDTNSTLAGALSAAKLNIPVAHVEAGLRSFNRRMPEEVNRVLVDHASRLLFAPTRRAVELLDAEGIRGDAVHLVGDVMFDVASFFSERAGDRKDLVKAMGLETNRYVLATVHRAENSDDPARLKAIINALVDLSRECPVVLPLHPRTRKAIAQLNVSLDEPGLKVVEPLGYLDMVVLERHAALIATDSGGVQKEAFFYKVPCVTLRDETEWQELVDLGWNRVVSPSEGAEAIESTLRASIGSRGQDALPYGDGHAAEKIVDLMTSFRA